jgi:hypothetical protein
MPGFPLAALEVFAHRAQVIVEPARVFFAVAMNFFHDCIFHGSDVPISSSGVQISGNVSARRAR